MAARDTDAGTRRQLVVAAAGAGYVVLLGVALRADLGEFRRTGERAAAWLERYAAAARSVPDGSIIIARTDMVPPPASDFSLERITSPDELILLDADALQHRIGPRIEVLVDRSERTSDDVTRAMVRGRLTFEFVRDGEGVRVREAAIVE
jgi:hypothetical protein